MASPKGSSLRPILRRSSTITLLATLAVLLAIPTAAFAVPISHPIASGSTGATAGHGPINGPAATAGSVSVGPTVPTGTTSSAGRIPLYERFLSPSARIAPSVASGATELDGAIASLAQGDGPAFGVPVACSSSAGLAAHCTEAAPSRSSTHLAALPANEWQNATPGALSIDSSSVVAGSVAWDAFDQAIIYFGGCDAYGCPDNQTWGYIGGYWQNLTDFYGYTATPPAVYEASMDYDYHAEQVVLFGGIAKCGSAQCLSNQTWTFSAGAWTNDSGPIYCGYSDQVCWPPAPVFGASMAFANDSADNETILFGGCLDLFCTTASSQTWTWSLTDGWQLLNPDGAPSARGFATMAYDATWGALLLFGGCTLACTDSDTWSFYNGQWTNETYTNTYYGFAAPPGRGAAEMTYDADLGVLFLWGGLGATGTNDLWGFQCGYYPGSSYYLCGWVNDTPSVNLPGAIDLGMAPSESSLYPPMVLGGECSCDGGIALFETFVFEPLFTGVPSVAPNPARIGQSVLFNANLSGGWAPYYAGWATDGYYYYGYGPSYLYSYYSYSYAGSYLVTLYAFDYVGVEFTWNTTELVGNISAQISVAHPSTEVGAVDTFSTPAATGGTAPYTYQWNFGDDSSGPNADTATHAYSSAGTYTATLTVTDANGLTNVSSTVVTVAAGPSVTVAASATTVDLGTALTFTPTPAGGIGPYTYAWTFGGGGTSTATAPTYTYTAAGTYSATVTVTDSVGGTATSSVSVTVNPAVSGTVSATPTTLTVGGSISYSAAGTGGSGTYTYAWVFGDGAKSSTATGTHTYATAGTYTAWVWINDTLGGSYSHSVTVTVQSTSPGTGTTSSTSGGLPGWALYAGLALVLIVVGGILLFVVGRRRKKETPPTAMPPAGAALPPPPAA